MFNPFRKIIGGGSYLGVDIGTTAIKIVEIGGAKNSPELLNYGILETYGHLERQNAAIQTGSLKAIAEDTAFLVRRLVLEAGFKSRDAAASLPSFSVFVTLLDIPQMPDPDIPKTLKFQIPRYIPMPPDEAIIDWIPVGERIDESGARKKQILLVAAPKESVERYKNIFKRAGLRLSVLEVESLSIIRALARNSQKPTLIVDIGSRSTNIITANKGSLLSSVQTDFAGTSLTQAIANGLSINIKRAEEIKRERGLRFAPQDMELSTLTAPFLDAILDEVHRAMANFLTVSGSEIEEIILAGGGGGTPGLLEYFKSHLEPSLALGDPFSSVRYDSRLLPIIKEIGPSLGVAVGLGIREFV